MPTMASISEKWLRDEHLDDRGAFFRGLLGGHPLRREDGRFALLPMGADFLFDAMVSLTKESRC